MDDQTGAGARVAPAETHQATLAQQIRAWRIGAGLSSAELAERLRVTPDVCVRYEQAQGRCPAPAVAARLVELAPELEPAVSRMLARRGRALPVAMGGAQTSDRAARSRAAAKEAARARAEVLRAESRASARRVAAEVLRGR